MGDAAQETLVAAKKTGVVAVKLNRPSRLHALSLAGSKLRLEAWAAGVAEKPDPEISAIIKGAMNSADYRECVRAFREKRKPAFTGR